MTSDNPTYLSSFMIRDAITADIHPCLELDHKYETDHVWQMRFQQDDERYQIVFQVERLPRPVELTAKSDEKRLQLGLDSEHCFLVAITKDNANLLGYLTMWVDDDHQIGWIRDLLVSAPYRRLKIGSRLLNVARRWAEEHKLTKIIVETRIQNYPGIQFCKRSGLTFCGFNDQYFSNHDIAVFFGQEIR